MVLILLKVFCKLGLVNVATMALKASRKFIGSLNVPRRTAVLMKLEGHDG